MFGTPSGAGRQPNDAVCEVGPASRAGSGFAARGAGFYVWAEDEAELRDWLRVLGPGERIAPPGRKGLGPEAPGVRR